jgi:hypothetical protein
MSYYILVLLVINLIGLYKYIDYSSDSTGVAYRTQMLTDFLCPIGGIVGRILFSFKLKQNASGIVFGLFLEIFITFLVLTLI